MSTITGLSGNEIYCLELKGFRPGALIVGNSVFSVGFVGGLGSSFKTLLGGEVPQITSVIHEGRLNAVSRMHAEAQHRGAAGITGVTSELVQHAGNVEFLSVGSCIDAGAAPQGGPFSTAADGQELYCQMDAGFHPVRFVFGNVAYSVGLGGGLAGALRSLKRGEVHEYSQVFQHTRRLALERIASEARALGANAVVGIKTSIIPFQGMQEMVMIGTASRHAALPPAEQGVVTSDLTNEEMWNLARIGCAPARLVLGVSVYALGVAGGLAAMLKSFTRGEISELTAMISEARAHALGQIQAQADEAGADGVVGVRTYVYQLGSGMIEFLAIGTAVKRCAGLKTATEQLPPQAIIRDKDTFMNAADFSLGVDLSGGA